MPSLVAEEKRINEVVYSWLATKTHSHRSARRLNAGAFCQQLAVEAALNRPLLLPPVALDKFLLGTASPSNDGFGQWWMQDVQVESCTYKPWMLNLMPRLTGLPIESRDDLVAYVRKKFPPLQPDWFGGLQRVWFLATTGARIPCPGLPANTPGFPLFYLLATAGMAVGMLRPGPMQKVHIAWVITLGFTASVVMLTGVVNPRYRFVFEPFALLYLFVLADALAAAIRRPPQKS